MRIGYISVDWSRVTDDPDGKPTPGGAGYYRCALPAKILGEMGFHTAYGPSLGTRPDGAFVVQTWEGEIHDGLDIVVLQRIMHREAPEMIRRARSTGQVIISDIDDWYDGLDTRNIAFTTTHPRYNADVNRNHLRAVMAASTALTTSTPYLAERLANVNEKIFVVPNAIDLDGWTFRDVGDEVATVGWVGATGFRSGDLEELKGVLGPWCEKRMVPFHHSGHAKGALSAAEALGIPDSVKVTTDLMTHIYAYPSLFDHFNIGLVPLRMTPFNFAKSDIKGLEYGAAGIPWIASATPAYLDLAATGAGAVAKRPKDWLRNLDRLLDPDEHRKAGQAARMAAETRDVRLTWTNWLDAYTQAQSAV